MPADPDTDPDVPSPPDPAGQAFAERLKRRRGALSWSLARLAEESGVSKSALSKIENATMSPTFETLRKLAEGFGVSLAELVADADGSPASTGAPAAARIPADPNSFTHQLLAAPGAGLAFTPVLTTVFARSLEEHGDWTSHDTADFLFCLEGRIEIAFRDHPSLTLGPGDAATMDGRAHHATLSLGETPARMLWVSGFRRER